MIRRDWTNTSGLEGLSTTIERGADPEPSQAVKKPLHTPAHPPTTDRRAKFREGMTRAVS